MQSKRTVGKEKHHWPTYAIMPMLQKHDWLVVKDTYLSFTTSAFHGKNVNVTSESRPHLRASLSTAQCIQKKVAKLCLTADPLLNCTCKLLSLHSQPSSMDLPCQDRSKHKRPFTPIKEVELYPIPHRQSSFWKPRENLNVLVSNTWWSWLHYSHQSFSQSV